MGEVRYKEMLNVAKTLDLTQMKVITFLFLWLIPLDSFSRPTVLFKSGANVSNEIPEEEASHRKALIGLVFEEKF